MANHVLVPIDGSEPSMAALDFVIEEHPDARITALHVIDPQNFYASTGIEGGMVNFTEIIENYEKQADRLLEDVQEDAAERGVDVETERIMGQVARSIVEYVEDHGIDHVVIGSHGRTGASRILLGSVAESVTRRSPVPVTVVR